MLPGVAYDRYLQSQRLSSIGLYHDDIVDGPRATAS